MEKEIIEVNGGAIVVTGEYNDIINQVREYVNKIRHSPTPKDRIKYRPGPKGKQLKYVDRMYMCETLDKDYPLWEFQLVPNTYETLFDHVQIMGTLKVVDPTSKQVRSFTCFGQESIKRDKETHEIENLEYAKFAETDCLKRCASMLGIASDVYSEDIKTEDELVISEDEIKFFIDTLLPIILEKYKDKPVNVLKQVYSFYSNKLTIDKLCEIYGVKHE